MTDYFDLITECCREFYKEKSGLAPSEMVARIMGKEGFPMHSPHHHYLVPAVLMTATSIEKDKDEASFEKGLSIIKSRAVKIPGAVCGEYGACGAAIGCGIFGSVWTGTTPYSKDTLGLVQRITANSLKSISNYSGPRCCKRVTFLAIQEGRDFIEENLNIVLPNKKIVCSFFKKNADCIGETCCFHHMHSKQK